MDRDSISPESQSSQRAGSSEPCSIRPNPFKDDGDTSRKRRRTSLKLDSRNFSVEAANPDEMAKDPTGDSDDLVCLGAAHTVDSAIATSPMDLTRDSAEAPAAARPTTPSHDHEHAPAAGTPSRVTLRLRKSDRQLVSDEDASPPGGVSLLSSPPEQPQQSQPQARSARPSPPSKDNQPPPPLQEVESKTGISAAAEAAASALALSGFSPALCLSDDGDGDGDGDGDASPSVEIVDVPDSDDEILEADDAITLLSENSVMAGGGGIQATHLIDPTPKFPFYQANDPIFDHVFRISTFLVNDENIPREVQLWIDRYLDFARHSTAHAVRQSFFTYQQLWVALPVIVTNVPQLRVPDYEVAHNPQLRRNLFLLCRSFARLTAHFVEFDVQLEDMQGLVSPPYIAALTTITERRSLAEEDRQELEFEEDDISHMLFAFLKYNQVSPNGTLTSLMTLLEVQASMRPMNAQAVENSFAICTLVAALTRETYRTLSRSSQTEQTAAMLNSWLVLGQQALTIGRGVFDTAMKDHIEYLNCDQTSQLIYALGELFYIDLCANPGKAAQHAATLADMHPDIQPDQLPDAFVMDWKIDVYSSLVKNSQMSLRLMAVDNLAVELVAFWKRYNEQGPSFPVVQYVAKALHKSDVVSYFLSPTCHPEVTERSYNIIGFLAISHTYTTAETDLFWKSVLSTQDPTNLVKTMTDVVHYFSHDTAVYFCERFMTVPLPAFTVYMRNLCAAVFRHLLVATAPKPESLNLFIPFKVCLRLMRELSSPADDGSTRFPEMQKFVMDKMEEILREVGGIDNKLQRHDLYRACMADIDPKSPCVLGSLSAVLIINRFCDDGVTDLGYLIREHNLTQLLIDNLEHAIASMPPSARVPMLNGDVNAPRRDVLFFILTVYATTLTPEHSARLWDLMFGTAAACEADRDASWAILTSFCSGKMMQRDNPFLLQSLAKHLSDLPTYCFCQGLLGFLREWLVPVLSDPECKLLVAEAETEGEAEAEAPDQTKDSADVPDRDVSSIALEQLWRIVLTTPSNNLAHEATQLLVKEVYIDSEAIKARTSEDMRMIHMALIERCLRQISLAAKTLAAAAAAEAEAGDSPDEQNKAKMQEQGLLYLRSVRVLQKFLQQYREAFPQCPTPDPAEVAPNGEPAGLKYQSFDGAKQTEVKPLHIGRRNTAGFLLESLKEATGFERCKIYAKGGPFEPKDISLSLEDLQIHDCLLLVRRDEPPGAQRMGPVASPSDMEAAILDHFQELWESLGLSEELASEVYELLVHLAVGESMLKLFGRKDLSYKEVLYADQPCKSLYALHALREFLVTLKKEEDGKKRSATTTATEETSPVTDSKNDSDTMSDSTSTLSAEPAAKAATSDGSVDSQMDTPPSRDGDMDMEDGDGNVAKTQETPETATPTYAAALEMCANLITGAICDPSITSVHKANVGLQTDLNMKLVQLLDLVLGGASNNGAILEKLDANLLSHLLAMLSEALEYPSTDLTLSLIDLLLRTVFEACSLSRNFWSAFQEHPKAKDLVAHLLLVDERRAVREMAEAQIGKRAVFGGDGSGAEEVVSLGEFQEFFLPLMVERVPAAMREPTKCEGLFNLIEGCFSQPLATGIPVNVEALLLAAANLILEYVTLEDATQPELEDHALYGLAKMIGTAYRAAEGSCELPRDFVSKLFWKHLFPPWQQDVTEESSFGDSQGLHIAQRSRTRIVLLRLVSDIVGDNPKELRKLVKNLDNLVPAEPSDEDVNLYHYELPLVFDRTRALRAPCGYVGLRNLSNTCYFNSLLTQLFMNVEFRRFMIHVDPGNEDPDSLIFQTRLLFSFMQNSIRRFLDTQTCTNTIKTYEDGPIDITIQMDVDEFYNLLFDRWEGQISRASDKKQLRSFYGGQIVQQIRSHQCQHVSERLEPFSAIQCDIKGKSNLMESLEAYVEGEVMEGENKYKCSDCNKHVVATKRACLKDMPDHLIFHLKRFEFNLRNGTRNKINDHFSFPHEIDMRPYTIDQLSNPDQAQPPDMFELVGVLVHAGTAESGHYYSFIRERPSSKAQGSWVEFNDDAVSEWDPALMEAQCFGGVDVRPAVAGYANDGGELIEKSYSAYMLFYQRRSALKREQEALVQSGVASPRKVRVLPAVAEHIQRENSHLLRRHVLFDPQHVPFVDKVLSLVQDYEPGALCSSKHKVENRALQMALSHLDQVAAHTRDVPDFATLIQRIAMMGSACAICSLAIYDYFAARPQVFHQLAQRCPDAGVRLDTCKLVLEVLRNVKTAFPENYHSLPMVHMDEMGHVVSDGDASDVAGDRYMDGIDDDDDAGDGDGDGDGNGNGNGNGNNDKNVDVRADDNNISTQRDPLDLARKCLIVRHAQGLIKILWDNVYVLLRPWPETFYFMLMFVRMGRAEVAAFMDIGGLRRALEVITADTALSGQSVQINRMLLNIERRRVPRPLAYDGLIAVVATVMAAMYVKAPAPTADGQRTSGTSGPLFVDDSISRFKMLVQDSNSDLHMWRSEFQMLTQDWPPQYCPFPVSIFVDKLVGLNQNAADTDAILVRLMGRHQAIKKMVFKSLKVGIGAQSNKNQAPYVRAAMAYIRNVAPTDKSALALTLSIAEECRCLTNTFNRRVYFEALRDLFYDAGGAVACAADVETGAAVGGEAAAEVFDLGLLEEKLKVVLVWAPGLLAFYDPVVNAQVEEFLQDNLFVYGAEPAFSAAEGGAARARLLKTIARQLGIALLSYLRDNILQARMRVHVRVVETIERVVAKLAPYFADAAATTADGDADGDVDADVDADADGDVAEDIARYRQLLSVVADLSAPPPSDVGDLEDEFESGGDEGDWNDDSSEVEDDSAGNISTNTAGELDADMP